MHLTNWKARRAGPRITVTGTGEDGKPAKIVGVDVIEPRGRLIVAVDKDGGEHILRTNI